MKFDLKKWLGIIQGIAVPIIVATNPELAPIAPAIVNAITEAEALGSAGTITDKLGHVQTLAANAATVMNTINGAPIINTSSLSQSVQEATDTVVAITNLVHSKSTPAETTQATPSSLGFNAGSSGH